MGNIKKQLLLVAMGLALAWPMCLPAKFMTPFFGRNYLVAGSGTQGHIDGNFLEAAFNQPSGLALSPDGRLLYVADTGNNAVRIVDLADSDKVSTLCGNASGLDKPTTIEVSADGSRVYVLNSVSQTIKVIKTADQSVETLTTSATELTPGAKVCASAMAYDRIKNRLYIVNPQKARL